MKSREIRSLVEKAFKGTLESDPKWDSLYIGGVEANCFEDAMLACSLAYLQASAKGDPAPLEIIKLMKTTMELFVVRNKGRDIFKEKLERKALKSKSGVKRGKRPVDSGHFCSFCAKSESEVRTLIAGPDAFICDGCVNVCKDILHKRPKTRRKARK